MVLIIFLYAIAISFVIEIFCSKDIGFLEKEGENRK